MSIGRTVSLRRSVIREATVCATVVASAQTAYDRVLASRLDTLEPKPVWNFFIRPAPGLNPHTLANVCVIDAAMPAMPFLNCELGWLPT